MLSTTRRAPVAPQKYFEDRAQIQAIMRDCSARSKLLRDHRSALLAQYPDQWVALGDNWEFVAADSHHGILEKLKECGAYPPHSVIDHLETNPPRRILTPWKIRPSSSALAEPC